MSKRPTKARAILGRTRRSEPLADSPRTDTATDGEAA